MNDSDKEFLAQDPDFIRRQELLQQQIKGQQESYAQDRKDKWEDDLMQFKMEARKQAMNLASRSTPEVNQSIAEADKIYNWLTDIEPPIETFKKTGTLKYKNTPNEKK